MSEYENKSRWGTCSRPGHEYFSNVPFHFIHVPSYSSGGWYQEAIRSLLFSECTNWIGRFDYLCVVKQKWLLWKQGIVTHSPRNGVHAPIYEKAISQIVYWIVDEIVSLASKTATERLGISISNTALSSVTSNTLCTKCNQFCIILININRDTQSNRWVTM